VEEEYPVQPLFTPRANLFARASLVAVLFLLFGVACFAYAYTRSSSFTGVGVAPEQPIPFSHHHHVAGLGIDCRFCHHDVEDAASAGMPTTSTCLKCHNDVWLDTPMLQPLHESHRDGRPVRWTRVHDLPDFVYFDHSIHVAKGVACETCHGGVDQMRLVYKSEPLFMKWCLECHRDPARFVRPTDAVLEMGWSPEESRREGSVLLEHNGIKTEGLTDCSTCHR